MGTPPSAMSRAFAARSGPALQRPPGWTTGTGRRRVERCVLAGGGIVRHAAAVAALGRRDAGRADHGGGRVRPADRRRRLHDDAPAARPAGKSRERSGRGCRARDRAAPVPTSGAAGPAATPCPGLRSWWCRRGRRPPAEPWRVRPRATAGPPLPRGRSARAASLRSRSVGGAPQRRVRAAPLTQRHRPPTGRPVGITLAGPMPPLHRRLHVQGHGSRPPPAGVDEPASSRSRRMAAPPPGDDAG